MDNDECIRNTLVVAAHEAGTANHEESADYQATSLHHSSDFHADVGDKCHARGYYIEWDKVYFGVRWW